MSRFRSRLIAILAASVWSATAFPAEVVPGETLESLLAYARDRNPEIAALRFEADAAGERVVPAGALPDPKFRTEFRDVTRQGEQKATLAPSQVGSTKYLLMQDLPWYGKRDLKREIAEQEAAGARGRAQGAWSEVAARIKATYAQLFFVQRDAALAQEILDLMVRLEKVAQARYAGGLAAQQDVIRAQVEQTAMRSELLTLENERHLLRARVNALLARPAGAPLAEPAAARPLPAPTKLDPAMLEDRLQAKNPQLFADAARIRAAEKGRDLAYKNRYPDFTVGVSPTQYQSSVKEWELMVEMNIPLQWSSRRAQERESEAMLAAARARKDATTWQLLAELHENLGSLESARRSELLASNQLLPQAKTAFRAALAGYENGKVDFATLLDAQRQIRQAKRRQLQAQTEAQMRLADIERLLGEEL